MYPEQCVLGRELALETPGTCTIGGRTDFSRIKDRYPNDYTSLERPDQLIEGLNTLIGWS